ncbi:MAG TPA: GNAT family N-acetyltransferase [Chitinophagaceae bacterium]|nr:GNAT family N-acetyltransferase [Chitinophagaceae bacterium]
MSYLTTLLATSPEKAKFSCGKAMLDNYIQKQARQDVKGKVAACFILSGDDKEIKGYYTLSNGSIPNSQLPGSILKRLPKYQDLPVTLLGRLAVDNKFQGQKLGKLLLLDALKRSYDATSNMGSMAVIVDPIDQEASDFYARYGFIQLPDSGRMFLPMTTIEQLFK